MTSTTPDTLTPDSYAPSGAAATMRAVAVTPGTPNSIHLREVPKPSLHDVPDGRGVLVRVLRVGVDGTDKEINLAEYGAAPDGEGSTNTFGRPSMGGCLPSAIVLVDRR